MKIYNFLLLSSGILLASCGGAFYDPDPFDQELPDGQKYHLSLLKAGTGVEHYFETTESRCGLMRAGLMTANPNAFIVENCKIVDASTVGVLSAQ